MAVDRQLSTILAELLLEASVGRVSDLRHSSVFPGTPTGGFPFTMSLVANARLFVSLLSYAEP